MKKLKNKNLLSALLLIYICGTFFSLGMANPPEILQSNQGQDNFVARNPILWIGSSNKHQVALTFDDGPDPIYTPQILDILAKYNIKATFMVIGNKAKKHPELIKRIIDEGHELGNHTISHPEAPKLTPEELEKQVSDNNALLQNMTGKKLHFFRPPYGYFDVAFFMTCRQHGINVVLWSIVPRDWEKPDASIITKRVLDQIEPGSIVLLHDGGGDRSQTVAALPGILDGLQKRNLKAVTLSELLLK